MASKINLDTSTRLDIVCRRGDTFSLELTIKNSEGKKINITEDRFSLQVRTKATADGKQGLILTTNPVQPSQENPVPDNSPALPLRGGVDVTDAFATFVIDRGSSTQDDPEYSVVKFSVDADSMANVPSGRYVYDLQRLDNDNSQQKTIITGTFVVKEDISEVGSILVV
ncbi:MAG: hypothetical protein Unbinned4409contig1001_17 [Prokaryotic dsDNA virus sp.]|nr:MAG: hypothetical protein Unbinned4409contig1001_17 [Prokaryotic dsDNA virus sp.]|tara:strand:- start:14554 stop:15060 length:507 start_codon:yes stop_codon:yes gene_type:complete